MARYLCPHQLCVLAIVFDIFARSLAQTPGKNKSGAVSVPSCCECLIRRPLPDIANIAEFYWPDEAQYLRAFQHVGTVALNL
jgi:hypothetical protein